MFETLIVFAFWISLLGVVYSYALYPLILQFYMNKKIAEEVRSGEEQFPSMSLIVTVHNEATRIKHKLENSLALEYPGIVEIIIASDGSSDATNDIVREYGVNGVKLVEVLDHKGKENAQLHGIKAASGDIIVFSDVATEIQTDSLVRLAGYFKSQNVGAVSSEDRFISNDGKVAGEGAYVKYEMWLRRCESRAAGLVGLSGSFFAARKQVCDDWDIYSPSDFNTAINCVKNGFIAVTMPDVHGYYRDISDPAKEYSRKIRTIIRGMTALVRHNEVLNPLRYGLFAFQVWSHKLMRWAVPWFMLVLFLLSVGLIQKGGIYSFIFFCQALFYGAVLVAYAFKPLRENSVFKLPYFFVQVNLAIAHATILFVSGKRMYTWVPSKR